MKKRFLYVILSVLTILALIVGAWLYTSQDNDFITYKDPQLTEEQKKRFIDEVAKSEGELVGLLENKQTPPEDVYQRYLNIASNYFPLGEYKKSQEAYLKAGNLLPQYPLPWYAVSTVELAMQDYKSSLKHIEKAIALDPANPEYWRFKIALVADFFPDKNLDTIYQQAMTETRESVDIISVYAVYLASKGDLEGSARLWRLAIEKNPEKKEVYNKELEKLILRLK